MENYIRKEVDYHGGIFYYNLKQRLHRLDGPAIDNNGDKVWIINGKIHRSDGPAVLLRLNAKEWWINSKQYSKSCHNRLVLFSILESQRFILIPTEDDE